MYVEFYNFAQNFAKNTKTRTLKYRELEVKSRAPYSCDSESSTAAAAHVASYAVLNEKKNASSCARTGAV